jgi:hypothetical protein
MTKDQGAFLEQTIDGVVAATPAVRKRAHETLDAIGPLRDLGPFNSFSHPVTNVRFATPQWRARAKQSLR